MSYFPEVVINDVAGNQADVDSIATTAKGVNTLPLAFSTGDFYPRYLANLAFADKSPLLIDTAGNLVTRSAVLTDEGSVNDSFPGVSLDPKWVPSIGAGGSISVANSQCVISSGTTAGETTGISRQIDFSPLDLGATLFISQRIANQDIYVGFGDSTTFATSTQFARFHYYGTDDTKVSWESQSSVDLNGGEGINTQRLLPQGHHTSEALLRVLKHNGKTIEFFIGTNLDNLVLVETYNINIPNPYTVLYAIFEIKNDVIAPASSTDLVLHSVAINNYNLLQIQGDITGKVSIDQQSILSGSNNSSANLGVGATFTGVGESSAKISGIQINFKSDQLCLVKCQQSADNINWDIEDSWQVQPNAADSRTVQATALYFRVLVTNQGTSTTTFLRLNTILCPIVEAVPRALSQAGGLLGTPVDVNIPTWRGHVTADGDLKTTGLGAPILFARFSGDYFDNFSLGDFQANGGTRANESGVCKLVCPISATPTASIVFTKKNFIVPVGKISTVYFVVLFNDHTISNNERRWGYGQPTLTSGLFFELIDGVLYASSYFDGVPTRRNIDYFRPADNTFYRYDIQMTSFRANFFINNVLVASISTLGTNSALYSDTTLPLVFANDTTGATSVASELWLQSMTAYNSAHQSTVLVDPFNNDQFASVSKSGRLLTRGTPELRFSEDFSTPFDTVSKWQETLVGSATAVQINNALILSTTTASGDSATEFSRLFFVPKSVVEPIDFVCTVNVNNITDSNNRREIGVKCGPNNGFFFRLENNTLSCVVLLNGFEQVTVLTGFGNFADDKFHTIMIKVRSAHYVWFYIDEAQVYFQAASGNQVLVDSLEYAPYFSNYNTAVTATPISLTIMNASIQDNACQTINVSGKDNSGILRELRVDNRGRLITAPFEPIQTSVTYLDAQRVDQIIETDIYGGVLTTTVGYTGRKVTSITQVAT